MRHLAALVRSLTDFRVLLALPSAFQRVYALLYQMGRPMPGGLIVIQHLPKQHEIAIMVNTKLAGEGLRNFESSIKRMVLSKLFSPKFGEVILTATRLSHHEAA